MKRKWESARKRRERQREARLLGMTPRARATYNRIVRLREEIGPVDFDITQALREIRNDEA